MSWNVSAGNPDNLNQNTSGQEKHRLAKHQSKEIKGQHFEKMFLQTWFDAFSLCAMQLLGVAGHGCMRYHKIIDYLVTCGNIVSILFCFEFIIVNNVADHTLI